MSMKKGTFVSLVLLLALAVALLVSSSKMSTGSFWTVDQAYAPKLLAIILVILCLVSWVRTWKKEDEKLEIPYMRYIFYTIGITIVYLIAWKMIGYFYVLTFLFLMALLFLYRKISVIKKKVYVDIVIALVMTGLIYFLFGYLLNIRF